MPSLRSASTCWEMEHVLEHYTEMSPWQRCGHKMGVPGGRFVTMTSTMDFCCHLLKLLDQALVYSQSTTQKQAHVQYPPGGSCCISFVH